MTTIVFDLETTGIPIRPTGQTYAPPSEFSCYDTSRIVQIAWIIIEDEQIIQQNNIIIKPKSFMITNSEFHGITHEKAMAEGVPIEEALELFQQDLAECSILVSHNCMFDYSIVASEIVRANPTVPFEFNGTRYCTMVQAKRRTWPKLTALYREYFKQPMKGAHNAIEDVYACARIYFYQTTKRDLLQEIMLARRELS